MGLGLVDDIRCSGDYNVVISNHTDSHNIFSDRVLKLILFLSFKTLSLELMTLEPVCKDVETAQGVPITVTGVAQVSKFILNFDLDKRPNKCWS